MLDQIKELLKAVIADDEFFDLMAQAMKKSHAALVKAGFTKEEATRIVASQGAGVKGS